MLTDHSTVTDHSSVPGAFGVKRSTMRKRRGVRVAIRASLLEVRRFDHERVAFPVASRVAHVELDVRAWMRSAVEIG